MAGESGESANKVKKRSEKNRAAADSKESLATFSFLCTENTKKAAASKDKLFRPSRYPGSRYVLSPCLRARPWNIWSREWELNPRPADFSTDIMLLDSRALFLTIPYGFAWYLASFVQNLFTTFWGEPLRWHKLFGHTCSLKTRRDAIGQREKTRDDDPRARSSG